MEGFEKRLTNNFLSSQAKPRIQAGNIHFCTRGNCRKVIFLEDEDKIEFLRRCKQACVLYDTQIEAFVIMDNHVHLQLITEQVTNFATWLLRGYSFWYNRKYSLSDKLFRTPFMSYCKFSDEWRLNSIFYILANPVKAGMCRSVKDYQWSSYHLMYMNRALVRNHINLETSFIYSNYKTIECFDNALDKYIEAQDILRSNNDNEVEREIRGDSGASNKNDKAQNIGERVLSNEEEYYTEGAIEVEGANFVIGKNSNFSTRNRMPTYEVVQQLNKLLGIRTLHTLSTEEQKRVIIALRENTGATYVQLAIIFDENYEYIRRIVKYSKT